MPAAPRPRTPTLAPDEYLLIGAGERFFNADGGCRQEELRRCAVGERITLRREPGNPRDPLALALFSCRGVQVGYLARTDARWIAPLIDGGGSPCVTVERVAPKGRPFAPLALTVRVRLRSIAASSAWCADDATAS